jgi:outer membrane receptor for ferrienterochelin and colicins
LAFELPNEGALSYNNFAANIMWDWQISPMFDLTNAVRVDHLELMNTGFFAPTPGRTRSLYDGTEITIPSFNSGLVIKATDLDTVRLTAARGLQVPSLFDFGLQIPLGYVNIVGTQSAQPTSVWDAELAYDRSIAALGATLTTAIYWQRNTDLLASAGSAGPTVVDGQVIEESENDGSSYELGLEVGLRGKTAGGMRWNISYRYAPIHDDITTLVQNSPTSIGSFDSGTPANEVIGGLGYTIDKWELDTMARYQSRFLDYSVTPTGVVPFTVDHYVVLNASVGYQVTKYLTLAGTAEQFDVPRVVETGSDYVNRQFIASATLKW